MKKALHKVISVILLFSLLIPNVTAFATESEKPEWQDVYLTEEQFDEIFPSNSENNIMPLAADLIMEYYIGISKEGNTLYIGGKTFGNAEVVKSGFTKVTIQKKLPTSPTWNDYITYKDLYADASHYILTKSVTLASGYQYRVVCTHYAKKNILSTQKIDNTSNVLIFL